MQRYYIFEALFILLGLALVVAIIKYPKDAFIKLPLGILKTIFVRPIQHILAIPGFVIGFLLIWLSEKFNWKISPWIYKFAGVGESEEQYPSTKNLPINFKDGDKYIFVISSLGNERELIEDMLEAVTGKYLITDFGILNKNHQVIINIPQEINFYDFHLLVQHFGTELGEEKTFGAFRSDKIQFYVYHDPETINNLVGFTANKKYFSIYMLDDLEEKQHLRMNQKLVLKTDWVEQWIGIDGES